MNVIFFGSTTDSVIVCDALFDHSKNLSITLKAVVTQPAKPIGRKHILTPTPVEKWSKAHAVACLTFETQKEKPWKYNNEQHVIQTLSSYSPDLLVSASYGQKIPEILITKTTLGGMNVHPSILPRWRGADPIPWEILAGDAQTGVTIVTLSKQFDAGTILSQQIIPMSASETPEDIRSRLFTLGSSLLIKILPQYFSGKHTEIPQDESRATYARRLSKNDGFIPWNIIIDAIQGNTIQQKKYPRILSVAKTTLPEAIFRAVRAFSPWPGVWSTIPIDKETVKRIKILDVAVVGGKLIIQKVQLEGKKPTSFTTFTDAYRLSLDNLKT